MCSSASHRNTDKLRGPTNYRCHRWILYVIRSETRSQGSGCNIYFEACWITFASWPRLLTFGINVPSSTALQKVNRVMMKEWTKVATVSGAFDKELNMQTFAEGVDLCHQGQTFVSEDYQGWNYSDIMFASIFTVDCGVPSQMNRVIFGYFLSRFEHA